MLRSCSPAAQLHRARSERLSAEHAPKLTPKQPQILPSVLWLACQICPCYNAREAAHVRCSSTTLKFLQAPYMGRRPQVNPHMCGCEVPHKVDFTGWRDKLNETFFLGNSDMEKKNPPVGAGGQRATTKQHDTCFCLSTSMISHFFGTSNSDFRKLKLSPHVARSSTTWEKTAPNRSLASC